MSWQNLKWKHFHNMRLGWTLKRICGTKRFLWRKPIFVDTKNVWNKSFFVFIILSQGTQTSGGVIEGWYSGTNSATVITSGNWWRDTILDEGAPRRDMILDEGAPWRYTNLDEGAPRRDWDTSLDEGAATPTAFVLSTPNTFTFTDVTAALWMEWN